MTRSRVISLWSSKKCTVRLFRPHRDDFNPFRCTMLANPRHIGFQFRRWQSEALIAAEQWWDSADPQPVVIRAVMGAGKSHAIGCAAETWRARCSPREHVVVTVPTQALVEQTADTIGAMWSGPARVSMFYGKSKEIAPIILTTYDSASKLAETLQESGRKVRMLIADEIHRTENGRAHAAFSALAAPLRLGFTATPWRSDRDERLSAWDGLLYDYGPAEALRDGVVVPFEPIPWQGQSLEMDDVGLSMLREAVERGPTIVSALSIDHAESFAAKAREAGIPALAVHSRIRGSIRDPGTELGQRIRQLQTGKVRAIVHVSMLQEGIDLPWIRCMVLLRPVASRVRFAQELGRALRASPETGKVCAYIYDPHDLCGALDMDYEAALGGVEEPPTLEEALMNERLAGLAVEQLLENPAKKQIEKARQLLILAPPAVRLSAAVVVLRKVASAWRQAGWIRSMQAREWRKLSATEKQADAVAKMAWAANAASKHDLKPLFAMAIDAGKAGDLDRGAAADLMDLLIGMADRRVFLPAEVANV